MARIRTGPGTRIRREKTKSGSEFIRSWFDERARSKRQVADLPADGLRSSALRTLVDSAELFGWKRGLTDRVRRTIANLAAGDSKEPNPLSVRFQQRFEGIPVHAAEIVVNLLGDGQPYSIYSQYHYDVPDELDPARITSPREKIEPLIRSWLNGFEGVRLSQPILTVYRFRGEPGRRQRRERRSRRDARDALPVDERLLAFYSITGEELKRTLDPRRRAPRPGDYFLAWEATIHTAEPHGLWRVRVDAQTGHVLHVSDELKYSVVGDVFDPNPSVSTDDLAKAPGSPGIQNLASTVDLPRLGVVATGDSQTLDGEYVVIRRFDGSAVPARTKEAGTTKFTSSWDQGEFLATMAYYHIDRIQHHLWNELGQGAGGFVLRAPAKITVDPEAHATEGSEFDWGDGSIRMGQGPVPDAADAHVLIHEFGHALLHHNGVAYSMYRGIDEGFCDFLAAIWFDEAHSAHGAIHSARSRGKVMCWNATPWDDDPVTRGDRGRRCDMTERFSDPAGYSGTDHEMGQVWASTMFELYRKLGGDSKDSALRTLARDLVMRLHIHAFLRVETLYAFPVHIGQEIEKADQDLGGWKGLVNSLHGKVIRDGFARRELDPVHLAALPIDVYIDDGRDGNYGSITDPSDPFGDKLFLDDYTTTRDVWVSNRHYLQSEAQTKTHLDHQDPQPDSDAHIYCKIKRKGTGSTTATVTVQAYVCRNIASPAWPDAWTAADQSISVDLPAGSAGVVVGPFTWHTGNSGDTECLLVTADCTDDPLTVPTVGPGQSVADIRRTLFDNNVGRRNVTVV